MPFTRLYTWVNEPVEDQRFALRAEFDNIYDNGGGATGMADGTEALPGWSFTNDTDTGFFRSAANTLDISAGGVRAWQFSTVASAVNYLDAAPAIAGSDPVIRAEGTSANIGIVLTPKDAGSGAGRRAVLLGNDGAAGSHAALGFLSETTMGMYRIGTNDLGFMTGGNLHLSLSGVGRLRAGNVGTSASPTYSFNADTDTGMFGDVSLNVIRFATGGVNAMAINSLQQKLSDTAGTAGTPAWSWTADANTGLSNTAADTIAVSTGGVVRLTINTNSVDGGTNIPFIPGAVSGTPLQHALYSNNVPKAWARVTNTATVYALATNFNVLSLADDGTGQFTLTWDRDFSGAGSYVAEGATSGAAFVAYDSLTAGTAQFSTWDTAGARVDVADNSVLATGNQ